MCVCVLVCACVCAFVLFVCLWVCFVCACVVLCCFSFKAGARAITREDAPVCLLVPSKNKSCPRVLFSSSKQPSGVCWEVSWWIVQGCPTATDLELVHFSQSNFSQHRARVWLNAAAANAKARRARAARARARVRVPGSHTRTRLAQRCNGQIEASLFQRRENSVNFDPRTSFDPTCLVQIGKLCQTRFLAHCRRKSWAFPTLVLNRPFLNKSNTRIFSD